MLMSEDKINRGGEIMISGYSKYLNMDAGVAFHNCLVCKSPYRDRPINKRYIYKIIITEYHGRRVISVSPSISENILNSICTDIMDRDFDDILQSQELHKTGYRLSKMYRMIINSEKSPEINRSSNFKIEYLIDYKKYVITDNGSIISYCKISDIDFGIGNIVVWTDDNYRRKGYARELLIMTILMCKSEGIKPVYLINSENIASIELAKSVGFETVQTEIIACEERKI